MVSNKKPSHWDASLFDLLWVFGSEVAEVDLFRCLHNFLDMQGSTSSPFSQASITSVINLAPVFASLSI